MSPRRWCLGAGCSGPRHALDRRSLQASGPKQEVIFKNHRLKLTGRCDGGSPDVRLTTRTGNSQLISSSVYPPQHQTDFGFALSGGTSTAPGQTTGITPVDTSTNEAFLWDSAGNVTTVDGLTAVDAFGRKCAWAGLVSTVKGKERLRVDSPTSSNRPLPRPADPHMFLDCGNDGSVAVFGNAADPNFTGSWSITDGGLLGRAFFPLDSDITTLLGERHGDTVGDLVHVTPAGRVTHLHAGMSQSGLGGSACQLGGAVRSVSKGPKRAFYASNPAPKRKEFFDAGGLHLYGSCGAGQMKIFARHRPQEFRPPRLGPRRRPSVGRHGRRLRQSAEAPVLHAAVRGNLAQRPAVYARPDGRMTSINWSAIQTGSAFKPCIFAGVARSG